MNHGTYSNGPPMPPITLESIREAARALEALGPIPPADLTVALDVHAALRDAGPPSRIVAHGPSPFVRDLGEVTIHADARIPAGTWHPGRPL
ncbi:MAG TPA: hypothetical protein VIU64_19530 [Polyangia bacterium]